MIWQVSQVALLESTRYCETGGKSACPMALFTFKRRIGESNHSLSWGVIAFTPPVTYAYSPLLALSVRGSRTNRSFSWQLFSKMYIHVYKVSYLPGYSTRASDYVFNVTVMVSRCSFIYIDGLRIGRISVKSTSSLTLCDSFLLCSLRSLFRH